MNTEDQKNAKVDFIMTTMWRAIDREPKLTTEEILFAVCYHLISEEGLEALPRIIKSLKKELKNPN